MYEHKIYQVEKAVAQSIDITLPGEFHVDFNEPEYPQTAQDQIMIEKWELENNLINAADLLVRRNKELPIEEAKKIIQENKGVNSVNSGGTVFDQLRAKTTKAQQA